MKTKIFATLLLIMFLSITVFSQQKSNKERKAEQKVEKQNQTEALVNSKIFVFNARTALPQGYKSVNLNTGTYTVSFDPKLIKSDMPFYGKAYSGIGYGGDGGMKFEGKPEAYTITKGKKNYSISTTVKGTNDTYRLSLSVGFEGSATLSITSNNRSFISYLGNISAPAKNDPK